MAAGSGRGKKQLLMSSLDMDAYFGTVADDSSRPLVPADHMLPKLHLPELLTHSGDLDEFSGLIPDPFAEGYNRAKADKVTAKSSLALPNLGKVSAKLGEGSAKSSQTLPKPDRQDVPSGKRLGWADSCQARVPCATARCVMKDAIKANQRCHESDGLPGVQEKPTAHLVTDIADPHLSGIHQPKLPTQASNVADAAFHSTPMSLAFANVRASQSEVPIQGCVPSQQGQSDCIQERKVRLHQNTAGGAAAATQPEAGTAVVTDANQAGVGHSKAEAAWAEAAWPLMPHVPKLRHGQQLRQAAAEAAAVAAGQAAKAASAVQLHTPPTIAFNSTAARHAMAATEAATAAASLTGGCSQHAMSISQEGFSKICTGQGTRAGRLYASAPASPVKAGTHDSHHLQAVVGRRTGSSTDTADVDLLSNMGTTWDRSQLHGSTWQSPDAARLTSPASGPQSPASGPRSPVMPSQATTALLLAQEQSEQLSGLHQHHTQHPTGSRHQLSKCLLHGQVVPLQRLDDQQQQQHRLYQGVNGQLMPIASQQGAPGGSEMGSQLGSHRQLQEHEDPFKASAMFPVYAEVSSGMPLTDCTNQLPSIQGCQLMAEARKSRPRRKHQLSRSTATCLSAATDSGSAFHAAAKSQHASVSQQTCAEAAEAQAVTAQHKLTHSASDAAALTSLSEDDFWEAARADLTDTAEVVRHRSRLHEGGGADSPVRTRQMSTFNDDLSRTPKARMYPMLHSGITPLLGMFALLWSGTMLAVPHVLFCLLALG